MGAAAGEASSLTRRRRFCHDSRFLFVFKHDVLRLRLYDCCSRLRAFYLDNNTTIKRKIRNFIVCDNVSIFPLSIYCIIAGTSRFVSKFLSAFGREMVVRGLLVVGL